ncbi:hypothetical protein tb265_32190 [Gemmatimonadetes bacterium T265]|nr:hypothetical protein tb265_32190 [Gemmatimonadetes bacterium T265]
MLSAQDRADIAQSVRDGQATARDAQQVAQRAMADAQRQMAQAQREMAQVPMPPAPPGAPGGNTSVIKDGSGRIVVTGPNGKTITIDPKAGLDGDQIQEMVQTALQPTPVESHNDPVPRELIPILGIMFPCLAAMVFFITRMFTARRTVAGATTATLPPDTVARLARIEQAVEAVAIEVERISEAQRYSAQLLTDRLSGPAPTVPAVAASARGANG